MAGYYEPSLNLKCLWDFIVLFWFLDSPLDLLCSPAKNGYYADPVLEAALEDDSDDLEDFIIDKQ